jgi:glycine betaine transporter
MLTIIISAGVLLVLALVAFCIWKWGNVRCIGVTPVPLFTFIAILFTSGLDVGLIMFPLREFPVYANTAANPQYAFTNPLAIEFGFWGFLIWTFYFLTSFYFCVIEPRVKFFDIPAVRLVNNIVIIGTCAFTASLFLNYLPGYIPEIGDGKSLVPAFYMVVFATILIAAFSATDIKYVRLLSVASVWLFASLILGMAIYAGIGPISFGTTVANIAGYFANIHKFVTPLDAYHEFYLFWWFAWSIMIGQFTSRFVGGLTTWQLLAALLIFPSLPIAVWFSVLYYYHLNAINTAGLVNLAMIIVGITFVINSLDSLIRLYTDNLGFTASRFGKLPFVAANSLGLFVLAVLFQSQWLRIEWIGTVVVGIYIACLGYILRFHRKDVSAIATSPADRVLDFETIKRTH